MEDENIKWLQSMIDQFDVKIEDVSFLDMEIEKYKILMTVNKWQYTMSFLIPSLQCLISVRDAINEFVKEIVPDDACLYCKGSGKGTMTMDKTTVKVKCHFCGGKGK